MFQSFRLFKGGFGSSLVETPRRKYVKQTQTGSKKCMHTYVIHHMKLHMKICVHVYFKLLKGIVLQWYTFRKLYILRLTTMKALLLVCWHVWIRLNSKVMFQGNHVSFCVQTFGSRPASLLFGSSAKFFSALYCFLDWWKWVKNLSNCQDTNKSSWNV